MQNAHVDADLASELIASGVTTQPVETVIAVLAATRDGASINAAAKAVWDQLPDCAADRGGCRRASAATARGGRLRVTSPPTRGNQSSLRVSVYM